MKNIKKIIPILIIFLTIGFAAVNYTLSLDGETNLTGDLEDFKVYFSRVLINGVEDNSIVTSSTSLDFTKKLDKIGEEYIITYDVTNASKYFDASISISCTQGDEYLSVINTFDTSNLVSLETRTGTLALKRLKSLASNESSFKNITCTINAQPIERETLGEGTITNPVNLFYIDREVSIGTEKFNIISEQEDTITMLAQYNIGTDYRQNTTQNYLNFRYDEGGGWVASPGPKEVDLVIWADMLIDYMVGYENYLQNLTSDSALKVDLIKGGQLIDLGCSFSSDYSYNANLEYRNCKNSNYLSWLSNGQSWWTKSAVPEYSDSLWVVLEDGIIMDSTADLGKHGIRPTITISKKTAQLLLKTYRIGKEVTIDTEKFNVISDNGTTISMLAQYNLGTDYRQSTTLNGLKFSDTTGWEYTPGPKEIDIQEWSTNSKTYINSYLSYLKEAVNSTEIKADLLTLKELEPLGCTISTNYSTNLDISLRNCLNSEHKNWLINGQAWWLRSASATLSNYVWTMSDTGSFPTRYIGDRYGIRPVITISKAALE